MHNGSFLMSRTDTNETDVLVPDPQVRVEFGDISEMATHRWDHDPKMAELGWPPPIRIRGRKFRSRRALEAFKQTLVRRAITERAAAPPDKSIARRRPRQNGTVG